MANKNERMQKLNSAGIDTRKYFDLDLPNGLKPGAKIQLVISENGEPILVCDDYDNQTMFSDDYIAQQIIADGYVRNTKLHRRFVMAQMFHMLNYVSYDGSSSGYNECLKRMYGYDYTLKMMTEEVKVLSKLEVRDAESFNERVHFFNKEVVVAVLEDYLEKLKEYTKALPNRNCKGVPYKKINGVNVFNADLDKKIYAPVRAYIGSVKYARNYKQVYEVLNKFMRGYIKLSYKTPKSKVWIDTFKGEGAYYTLKNLIMFHGCAIEYRYEIFRREAAMQQLKYKLDDYQGEGWRMFALMKKVIEDNNFDFYEKMDEIYNN